MMRCWRVGVAVLLIAVFAVPLLQPFATPFASWPWLWQELERLAALTVNTGWLVLGTLALALPASIASAVLLNRTDLPGRHGFRLLVVFALFVPTPLIVSAWEAVFGFGGWMHGMLPVQGLLPAIVMSAAAGLPWAILIVGMGLSSVEAELEEDALLLTAPWRVLWAVTLPRCRESLIAAGVWITLLTATDVTVTDRMQVRTFAEEAWQQLKVGEGEDRIVLMSLPAILVGILLLLWLVPRLQRTLPPLSVQVTSRPLFRLGRGRWLSFAVVAVLLGAAVLPIAGLAWKLGLQGHPVRWSALQAAASWHDCQRLYGWTLLVNLGLAAITGVLIASLALLACWAAAGSFWLRAVLVAIVTLAWALPGPVVGLGLKQTILMLITWVPLPFLADVLYRGGSYVPTVWASTLRFFPYSILLLGPAVRLVPTELREAARMDGAGPARELCSVVWPVVQPVFWCTALVAAALALGEVSASFLARTPGAETFALLVLDRLHYGTESDVAALCLIFLGMVGFATVLVLFATRWKTFGFHWPTPPRR